MHDFRDAFRQLTHRPAFALTVTLTLALGIGANALVFSVVHSVLLKPLPFPSPAQLVTVWQTQPGNDVRRVAPANFLDWRAASSFAGLAAYDLRRRTLPGDEPERIMVATVSSNFFQVLGVDALTGRTFREPTTVGGVRDVVLREDLWRRRFGADHGVIGRNIRLDDESLTVVGIVRVAHAFPEDVFAWTQARHDVPELSTAIPDIRTVRDARYLRVIGRMRDGVTMTRAQTEMDAIAARLREAYPDENAETGVNIDGLQEHLTGASAQTLWILFGVVACVMAIACANVAALFMAGALGRARELQIRAALGASRARLVRQLSIESLVLAAIGSTIGVSLAWLLRPALVGLLPAGTPRLGTIEIDGTVIAFALAIGVLTTLASGVLPGLIAARRAATAGLRDGGRSGPSRRAAWLGSGLMAAQLALAVVLVAGTGLMLRTLLRLYDRDPGIDVERLLALDIVIPDFRSRGRAAAVSDIERMTERIGALPGVTGAGAIQSLPLAARGPSANIRVDGRVFPPNEAPDTSWRTVTPGYFAAAGIPIVRGRGFTDADREGSPPVAVINATLAALLWPDADPLGKRIGTGLDGTGAPVLIVGVAGDVPQEGISARVMPEMYRPLAQPSRFHADAMSIVVRTDGDPARLAAAARQAVREIHPQAPVSAIRPMSSVAALGVAREVTAARALGLFGALALLLAAVGLHGVMARLVNDRRRELGIRIALGAEPRAVRWLVVGRTLRIALVGIVTGITASVLISRQLGALLHGVSAADPVVLAGASAVLLTVALLASFTPARRAARVDPLAVMKTE